VTAPKTGQIAAEVAAAVNSRPWRTAAIAVIAMAMCVSVFLTTGRSAATQRRILEQVELGGARLITMMWRKTEGGIAPDAVRRISNLNQVEWAFGLSPAVDLRNEGVPGGTPCPAKAVIGNLPPDQVLVSQGRSANKPGEATVSATAAKCLGLAYPSGSVSPASKLQNTLPDTAFAVVGQIEFGETLASLESFALLAAPRADSPATSVMVLARSAQDVADLSRAMARLSGAADSADIAVETSAALAELNESLETELASNSRTIGIAVIAAGMAFAGVAMMLSVGSQRRDFGRRRALGASRSLLRALVVLEGMVPAVIGAIAGSALGMALLSLIFDTLPGPWFALSIPALSTIAMICGSIPAALTAATRDPVSILRVP
jgi:putative ABC transport system permease protein